MCEQRNVQRLNDKLEASWREHTRLQNLIARQADEIVILTRRLQRLEAPETHVDRVAFWSGKLLGRYASPDHPDIGAQERTGWATYVSISEPHTMADCPF